MDIRRLRDEGLQKCDVAELVGVDRKTVAKYWDGPTEGPETPRYKKRQRKIDPYMDYITVRLEKWPQLSADSESRVMGLKFPAYAVSEICNRWHAAFIEPVEEV